jgi:hypothetical protein
VLERTQRGVEVVELMAGSGTWTCTSASGGPASTTGSALSTATGTGSTGTAGGTRWRELQVATISAEPKVSTTTA